MGIAALSIGLIAFGFSVATALNSWSIIKLYKLNAKNMEYIANLAELLEKISKTRWGVHD